MYFTESIVEEAALPWLESLDWQVMYSPDIAQECLTFATLRDTLLPKLISGKLRMKEAERVVEKVV